MTDDFDPREPGSSNLFAKTLLVLYAGLLAFTGGRAHAMPRLGGGRPVDEDFVARLRQLKYKPRLVLKLNLANPLASKAMMHTSHRSHSSHSSHTSHSSHYSSSTYTPSSGSGGSSTPSYSAPSYSPPPAVPSYSAPSYVAPRAPATRRSAASSKTNALYSPAVTTAYALGDRVLKLGDRGVDVTALQQLLIAAAYEITASGVFGLATNAAVKDFQAAHDLPADGVVGAQTLSALQQ